MLTVLDKWELIYGRRQYGQLFSALQATLVLIGIFFLYEDWNPYPVCVCACVRACRSVSVQGASGPVIKHCVRGKIMKAIKR